MSRVLSHKDLQELFDQLIRGAGPEVAREFERVWTALLPKVSTRRRIEESRNARAIQAAARAAAASFDQAATSCPPETGFLVASGRGALVALANCSPTNQALDAALALRSAGDTLCSSGAYLENPNKWDRAVLSLEAARLVGMAEGLLLGAAARTRQTSVRKRKRAAPKRDAAIEKAATSPRAGASGAVVARLTGVSERTARRALAEINSRP